MIEPKEQDPSVRLRSSFLKAKSNGYLSLANFHLDDWPAELCSFNTLNFDGGKSWEELDLNRIDLSYNNLTEIDAQISNLQGLVLLKMVHNK